MVHHVSRQSVVIYRAEEVKGIVWQIIKISSQTNFEWLAESLLHLNHQLKGQFELQHFSNKSGLMRGGKKRHVARATQRVRQCRCRPQIGLVQVLQRCYVVCWVTPAYCVHQHLQFHVSTLMRDKPFSFDGLVYGHMYRGTLNSLCCMLTLNGSMFYHIFEFSTG